MAKKLFQKALSVGLSLTLCAGLVAPSFAASFTDLQSAIDGKRDKTGAEAASVEEVKIDATLQADGTKFKKENDETDYFGYAWNKETEWFDIEAWKEQRKELDDQGSETGKTTETRNVQLNEDVEFDKSKGDKTGIALNGSKYNVNLELNGHEIDLNPGAELNAEDGEFYRDGEKVNKSTLNHDSVIWVRNGAKLTVTDETAVLKDAEGNPILDENGSKQYQAARGEGKITGGYWTVEWDQKQAGGVSVRDADFTMKGGSVTGNWARWHGAGIFLVGWDGSRMSQVVLDGVTVSGNYSERATGGGIRTCGAHSSLDINGCLIIGNQGRIGGGIVLSDHKGSTKVNGVHNSLIANNRTAVLTGGFLGGVCGERGDLANWSGTVICGNKYGTDSSDTATGAVHNATDWDKEELEKFLDSFGMTDAEKAKLLESMAWNVEDEDPIDVATSGTRTYTCPNCGEVHEIPLYMIRVDRNTDRDGDITDDVVEGGKTPSDPGTPTRSGYTFGGWFVVTTDDEGNEAETPFDPSKPVEEGMLIRAKWTQNTNGGSGGGTPGGTPIDDEQVPLSGLFTRADAIGYLWQQAGEPEWELSDFPDVPEDHQWAVAIGWAQDMGIALADEEGSFRPDDLVLRSTEDVEGELQEFLNRYAVYAGIELDEGELFIELAGAPDDVIMGEDAQVIFDDFFAKLEAALAEQAA